MNFNAETAGNYSIALDHADGLFAGSQDIFLKDKFLNSIHDLKQSDYAFASAEGNFADRFEIIYQNTTLGVDNPEPKDNQVVVFKEQGVFKINSGKTIIADVKVFDIRGRLVYEKNDINSNATSLDGLKAEQEVLLLRIVSDEAKVFITKVVN